MGGGDGEKSSFGLWPRRKRLDNALLLRSLNNALCISLLMAVACVDCYGTSDYFFSFYFSSRKFPDELRLSIFRNAIVLGETCVPGRPHAPHSGSIPAYEERSFFLHGASSTRRVRRGHVAVWTWGHRGLQSILDWHGHLDTK